jgi:hypothetical protein
MQQRQMEYLSPGHQLVVSPNRRHVAFLTSGNGMDGFHNIWIFDAVTGQSRRLLSLWETDPGSGTSFDYDWSHDSKALVIKGSTQGFRRDRFGQYRKFILVYDLESSRFYDVPEN